MQGILPYLISGISVGGQYALIAIGYTLVYGILRLINFAHGDVFMVAGLIMVYTTASMPMYISIPLVLIFTVILGFAIERVAYKPLRTAPRMSLMISAIGVSYLIQNLAFYLTGGLPQPVKTPIPWISDTVTLFGASTKRVTVVTPLLTIALVFALVALIKKTKIGMGMRAAAKDFETAQLMGVKINSVISMTFVIGSFLAAVGAMLDGFCAAPGDGQLALLELLQKANLAVNRLLGAENLSKSGSTLAAALIRGGRFHWLSVGDSRIVLLRGGALIQLNREHIYKNELLLSAVNGQESFASALSRPKAAGLTSYLGMGRLKHVDIPAAPVEVLPGDVFVLMSDGVYNALDERELISALSRPAHSAADEIKRAVTAKGYRTQDNFTAVIIEAVSGGKRGGT